MLVRGCPCETPTLATLPPLHPPSLNIEKVVLATQRPPAYPAQVKLVMTDQSMLTEQLLGEFIIHLPR